MLFQNKHTLLFLALISIIVHVNAQENYTLQDALKAARSNNPTLKAEQYEVEFAKSDVLSAKLRLNPTLENESIQLMRRSEFANNTHWYDGQNREVFWHISKPFQWAGQRRNTIAVANKSLSFTEEEYANVERELFLEVAQKWLDVWTTQKQLEIIQTAKNNIDSLTEINQRRYQSQVITQTDLFRTELLAKQYAIQLKNAVQEVKNHQKELGFFLGVNEEVQVDSSANFIFDMPNSMDSLLTQSLEQRSDIRSAKHLIDISESNVKLQKSLAIPQPELGVIFNPMNTIPYLGISFAIDIPFFDRNQGERKKSFQLREQAESRLFTVQRQIETEISIAYANYTLQQENIEQFEELLIQSESILENVKQAYLRGGTTIIDFLEAQRSWLEIQQEHYEAQQAYIESHVQLLYATGLINQLAQ
ncbi:MAG TPA: TolC family protein [Brumimicrobium sp.]|nr:TolC family protein [Brumimicrobium sp.]